MHEPTTESAGGPDFTALDAITEAVESGAGLPEVLRAVARTLDASLAVADAWGVTLAVAARSPADEQSLLGLAGDVSTIPLRVADSVVGRLHVRVRGASRACDSQAARHADRLRGAAGQSPRARLGRWPLRSS